MASAAEIVEEYRISYHQLQALDRQQREEAERLDRDFNLARARYEKARSDYQVLALGEPDEFCEPEGPEE